jgi:hypothetical protein
MEGWLDALGDDPRPWLLEESDPAVRHLALRWLEDRAEDDPEVVEARARAMASDPIAAILAAGNPAGWWAKPGPGYGPKYMGTTWSLVFLDQLGADGRDERIRTACAYLIDHARTASGGLGSSATAREDRPPPPSAVVHCLNGNLLRALIGFGWFDDERVQQAVEWQARAITGEGSPHYYASSTSGPGFACAVNEGLPCAWGAIKALLGLARVPSDRRSPLVRRAIDEGAKFLLAVDPATASYPAGWGNAAPNRSWFKLGFPSGYVADVLQDLEALVELEMGRDPRTRHAIDWVLAKRIAPARWKNEYAYNGKTWIDVERQGQPSKWVTLRACRVLRAALA